MSTCGWVQFFQQALFPVSSRRSAVFAAISRGHSTLSLNEFAGFFFPSTERKTGDDICDPVGGIPMNPLPAGSAQ